jgi:hypothetical protein
VMPLPVIVAFAGVLVAAVATGMLAGRCVRRPHVWLLAWTVAVLGLAAALGAVAMGLASGFGPLTFRAVQLGAELLAPLWLAWGLVELVARGEAVRFGARLICGALTIAAGLILATETLTTRPFSTAWPMFSQHDQGISLDVLLLVQAVAAITTVAAVCRAWARQGTSRSGTPRWLA